MTDLLEAGWHLDALVLLAAFLVALVVLAHRAWTRAPQVPVFASAGGAQMRAEIRGGRFVWTVDEPALPGTGYAHTHEYPLPGVSDALAALLEMGQELDRI